MLETSKQWEDLRAKLALSFWKFGRSLTGRFFERAKLDSAAKRVVRLSLEAFPVRSLEEYVSFGKTSVTSAKQTLTEVRDNLKNGGFNHIITPVTKSHPNRRYYTIFEACLVAILSHVESTFRNRGEDPQLLTVLEDEAKYDYLIGKDMWMSLSDLIPVVDGLLRKECPGRLTRANVPDNGASHYLEQSTRSIEFLQVTKLEGDIGDQCGARIKRHKWKGQVYFELLPLGYRSATVVRTRPFPEPDGHYRCSRIANASQVEDQYTGIVLGVDSREGGGGCKVLHSLCNKLDMIHVPFFVGSLSIGDYCFFTRKDGGKSMENLDYSFPIIVERKSIQDVAQSIYNGRWTNQKRRMYVGQYVFGYDNCKMVYIIEGNENAQTVSGGYVGARHFNVDKDTIRGFRSDENAISREHHV